MQKLVELLSNLESWIKLTCAGTDLSKGGISVLKVVMNYPRQQKEGKESSCWMTENTTMKW